MSLGGPRHGARVWCLGRVPKHRNQWQEVEGLLFSPQNSQLVHILSFVPRVWFPYSFFQQVRQPSIPSPVEEDTPKIQDTTGTIFIQGPSIVLPVWRCIMFNGSYLRACSNQMVNTRHGSDQQQGQNNQGTGIPMPPPLTPEQYFQLQMQMMATLNNTIQALQHSHTQPPPPPPPQTRDRRTELCKKLDFGG